jgi:1-deoxy-D-xylulose-5-phosphate synthase
MLRPGRDLALLAVGTMVQPALAAAEQLAGEGIDCAVVNCRFIKPMDQAMLDGLMASHKVLVTLEEGTIVNGFGATLSERLQTTNPEVRIVALGVPDRLMEQAPRGEQLATFGLTPEGIARRVSALHHEESLEAR